MNARAVIRWMRVCPPLVFCAAAVTEQLEMMGRRGELQEAPAVYAQLRDSLRSFLNGER